jgi:DNA repair ATPase RecN
MTTPTPQTELLAPVSYGELLDKIAILQIKSERMADPAKLANVRNELSALERIWLAHPAAVQDIAALRARLKAVNERLWVIEDEIRLKEKAQAFDDEFIRLARSVYVQNDERARIKKDINLALGSAYVEEKSYQDYGAGPA